MDHELDERLKEIMRDTRPDRRFTMAMHDARQKIKAIVAACIQDAKEGRIDELAI